MELGDLELGSQRGLDPNRSEQRASHVLEGMKRVAVLGASANELRKSYRVIHFLIEHGVEVVRVSDAASVEGLDPIPDAAIVFCTPDEVAEVASTLVACEVAAIWFQEGLVDRAAARSLEASGKVVIMDSCVMRAYRRHLLGDDVESWFPI